MVRSNCHYSSKHLGTGVLYTILLVNLHLSDVISIQFLNMIVMDQCTDLSAMEVEAKMCGPCIFYLNCLSSFMKSLVCKEGLHHP